MQTEAKLFVQTRSWSLLPSCAGGKLAKMSAASVCGLSQHACFSLAGPVTRSVCVRGPFSLWYSRTNQGKPPPDDIIKASPSTTRPCCFYPPGGSNVRDLSVFCDAALVYGQKYVLSEPEFEEFIIEFE